MRRACCLSNWRTRAHRQGLVAPQDQDLRRNESCLRFMMELMMPIYRVLIGIVLLALSPSLAAAQQQQVFVIPNNLFTAAGFMVKYATTPEKRALLNSLPPDKLVKRTKDGIVYYVYADAARCNCAYVGTAQAYAAYQNGPFDPAVGGTNNALQAIDSDVTAPYIPANIGPSMDSILQPDF
jgi:hypothetical protein